MNDIFATLTMYLQYPFVQRALVVGILIAFCASLLGVTLVLKRFSLLGDGLSHVAFGSMCLAAILHMTNDMLLILPVTIFCAVFLLRGGAGVRLGGDAAIAVMSVSALAIGYLFLNVFSASANISGDVCTTLFGATSILTLSNGQVWLSVVLSAFVILVYIFFYNKIFAITFDETFSAATGVDVKKYNLLIAVVFAVMIVLAMKLVGSLLISAFILFPALSAMRIFKSYGSVILCAAILSVFCAAFGILAAVVGGTPVGATIVAVDLIVFLAVSVMGACGIQKQKRLFCLLLLLCTGTVLCSGCGEKEGVKGVSHASGDIVAAKKEVAFPSFQGETKEEAKEAEKAKTEKAEAEKAEAEKQEDFPQKEDSAPTAEAKTSHAAAASESHKRPASEGEVDIDLTGFNANMLYAEVYNMEMNSDDYEGKSVRLTGEFACYIKNLDENGNPIAEEEVFVCLVSDAMACCQSGMEFIPEPDAKFWQERPPKGSPITVTGVFHTFAIEGVWFKSIRLDHARVEWQS